MLRRYTKVERRINDKRRRKGMEQDRLRPHFRAWIEVLRRQKTAIYRTWGRSSCIVAEWSSFDTRLAAKSSSSGRLEGAWLTNYMDSMNQTMSRKEVPYRKVSQRSLNASNLHGTIAARLKHVELRDSPITPRYSSSTQPTASPTFTFCPFSTFHFQPPLTLRCAMAFSSASSSSSAAPLGASNTKTMLLPS